MCAKSSMIPIKHTLRNIISKFKLTSGVQIANKKVNKRNKIYLFKTSFIPYSKNIINITHKLLHMKKHSTIHVASIQSLKGWKEELSYMQQ
jgi:hypothetical protein